jgi:hypothetical protein
MAKTILNDRAKAINQELQMQTIATLLSSIVMRVSGVVR